MKTAELQQIKQNFGIIGNYAELNRAIDVAVQVAGTDLSVLVTGESGVGKENIPRIIHANSPRKHSTYIAVNCGAIPEGTIDSELFGHEKGSFTGAISDRKGYFEVADGGTIFLDEIGEMPMATQARLLRVLETGEFIKVGSSKVQHTNVRVIAATNVDMPKAIADGRFREDLYYRLNTVPIFVPPLRKRGEDIVLLFMKFASDFGDKYHRESVQLTPEAENVLMQYAWPGNIRQLKNIAEQISVLERDSEIGAEVLKKYLPLDEEKKKIPMLFGSGDGENHGDGMHQGEREILYKIIYDMKTDINDLKQLMHKIMIGENVAPQHGDMPHVTQMENERQFDIGLAGYGVQGVAGDRVLNNGHGSEPVVINTQPNGDVNTVHKLHNGDIQDTEEYVEIDNRSIVDMEREMIEKALERHKGNRKMASRDLGISERTLYRKIQKFNLE